jgi:hypothetical protein
MIEVHEMGRVPDRRKLIEFLKTIG